MLNLQRSLKNEGLDLVFCFLPFVLASCFSKEAQVLNKTVLTVNGHEVSTQEFSQRLASRLKHFDALHAKDETTLARAKDQTVQLFILEHITRDFAKANKLEITEQEVDEKVREIRSRYPDDFAFRRALADEHMTLAQWRDDLAFTLLQKKVFSKIGEKTTPPTENEMREYYEKNKLAFQRPARVRLRQIVLEKEDDAKRISEELAAGASLEKLARQFSVAPEAASGGDTGWIEKGTLEVFDQAFKLGIGGRSKILKSPYGFHIYEVLKKEAEGRLSFEDAKAKIRAQLLERREQSNFSNWLEEQVRAARVQKNEALIDAIRVSTRGS